MIAPVELREHDQQRLVVGYLRAAGVLFCAIPNAARRSARSAAYLKAEGMRAGAPDLLVFSRLPSLPAARGMALELKRGKGSRVSPAQADWHEALRREGWHVVVAYGWRAAIEALHEVGL